MRSATLRGHGQAGAGKTPQRFILETIAEKTEREERRTEFHEVSRRRYAKIVTTGRTIPWSAMRAYLGERLAGRKPRRPGSRKFTR